jgi:hypothetical protein
MVEPAADILRAAEMLFSDARSFDPTTIAKLAMRSLARRIQQLDIEIAELRVARAVILTDLRSGARVGIALDLGHVPAELPTAFARLDLIVVESNHDVAMLDAGPYPHLLKQRIRGGLGHLSNRVTSGLLSECAHRGLRGVLLAHLSETNNTPELAITGSQQALRRAGWSRDRVWAAPQRSVCGPMGLDGALGDASARQLSLGL